MTPGAANAGNQRKNNKILSMVNRRKFLKNFSVAGTALAVPAVITKAAASAPVLHDLASLTLKGKVNNKGRGIPGVAVTDGINVTVTDTTGAYELKSNNTADHVYISIPAGYAFPNERGIAQFYKPITEKKGVFTADFNLEKLEVDDNKHHFVVWADTQMISEKDAAQLKSEAAPDLRDLVKTYPAGSLFHGIGCGDLVWDRFELFE
ncbi:MAG TPA: metallophosphoesterase N-terminal domain-containing protein, partial [Segetibacter sp.]